MNFLKEFIMNHPFISMLVAAGIYNRVEDAVYLHQAKKTGMPYNGHRWRYGMPNENGDKQEVKDE